MNLRPARWEDRDLLYQWRTEGEQADWWQGENVTVKGHNAWLWNRLKESSLVTVWVAEHDGQPCGTARIDSNGEISFHLDPRYRGRGLGTQLVAQATAESGWHRLKASVDRDNEQGIRALLAAGYSLRDDVVFLRWPE